MVLEEDIAAWAVRSYQGDAAWMVHSTYLGSGSLASWFWEGLRAYFIRRPFLLELGRALAQIRDEVSVSIKSQELAQELWEKHAEEFLRTMFAAHDDGKLPFGENHEAIETWVRAKI